MQSSDFINFVNILLNGKQVNYKKVPC